MYTMKDQQNQRRPQSQVHKASTRPAPTAQILCGRACPTSQGKRCRKLFVTDDSHEAESKQEGLCLLCNNM